MIRVTIAKEASAAGRSLEEHAISPWVWRAIGNAMLYNVNIDTGTKRFVKALTASTVNYFFNQEIGSLGVLTVKECHGNPNFIIDFELGQDFFYP
jgi:hypothetical protein